VSQSRDKIRILWLTNIPTPYTVPVWRELSAMSDLTLACLSPKEPNRDWSVATDGLALTQLSARSLRLGTDRILYGPSARLLPMLLKRPHVVVIDGWESIAAAQAFLIGRLLGAKILLSYWSTDSSHRHHTGPIAHYRGWLFRRADGVLTPGIAATRATINMGVTPDRITTGMAAIDVCRFSTRSDQL